MKQTKKAFTLAEVLITLSILGVVAALTIPSLVNRQSEVAAKSRMKKAIANFENVAAVYMAETGDTNTEGMVTAGLGNYFKIVTGNGAAGEEFVTADGVSWTFNAAGNVVACDSAMDKSPRYCVQMWTGGERVNDSSDAQFQHGDLVAFPEPEGDDELVQACSTPAAFIDFVDNGTDCE